MNAEDKLLPPKSRKAIEAADFLLVTVQLQVRSAMRNADPGLAAAYAELGVLLQDAASEARADGIARLNSDKPEAALAGRGQ